MSLVFVLTLLFSLACSDLKAENIAEWLAKENTISTDRMMKNIGTDGSAPGVVIASPEKINPPYYYHWTRDSSLTMDVVLSLYLKEKDPTKKAAYRKQLLGFVSFSRATQLARALGGIGEPKYYVDGTPFEKDWCRPQNDGPAIRAVTLIHLANALLEEKNEKYVKEFLYDGLAQSQTVIKTDLEYISHQWQNKHCDLWEESFGHHFYARIVQRRAMIEGARLAERLGDTGAAAWYLAQANALQITLEKHWDPVRQLLIANLESTGTSENKLAGIDSAVILGVLHGDARDHFLSYTDPRVLSTFKQGIEAFRKEYPINQRSEIPGVAIGRYPEDKYAGQHMNYGNPWVLATLAYGRFSFLVAEELAAKGDRAQAQLYATLGDQFLARVKYHANPDGSLSEQMDRYSGFMTSAPDLTWGYAELIQAADARISYFRNANGN